MTAVEKEFTFDNSLYPTMNKYMRPLKAASRSIIGRDMEIVRGLAALARYELCNPLFLAEPGVGKTSVVQAMMLVDDARSYYEIDLERMLEDNDKDKMASVVKRLFDEVEDFHQEGTRELVLFMDEVHRLLDISPLSVEAIKPVLANSGSRGLKIIAATTKDEYLKFIAPNAPLAERFQRIDMDEPTEEVVISILRGFVERYGQSQHFPTDRMFRLIYDYSNRYIPESVQPRKSIKILDEMFGMHRSTGRPLDEKLLADVIYSSTGNNVAFRVDVGKIESTLNSRVFGQQLAVRAVAKRMHLAIAGFNDFDRPMGSFLFAGPSGVGKTELTKQLADLLFGDGRRHFIRFDMAEFSNDEYVERFREDLTARVWSAPYSVILLDEIEKASPAMTRLLLSVFDDARLTDRNGREVSFRNAWIVCTTNAGAGSFSNAVHYINEEDGLAQYVPMIERSIMAHESFPIELFNRIDKAIPFMPLLPDVKRQIIEAKLRELYIEARRRHGIRIEMDARVMEYLNHNVVKKDTSDGGARGAIRAINDEVATAMAEFINKNPTVRSIKVNVEGVLRSEDVTTNTTDARVVVSPS